MIVLPSAPFLNGNDLSVNRSAQTPSLQNFAERLIFFVI